MNDLETGKDKIKKICEILKNESLEPAKEEAQKIIADAEEEAANIVREANFKAKELLASNQEKMQMERRVFESSLAQAGKQAMEALRQMLEKQLFSDTLSDWVKKQTADPKVAAQLITALVQAIEKEGVSANFSALIPPQIPSEKVNALLAKGILEKLREKSLVVGNFDGGVQLKLHDQKLTLDLSDEAIYELMEKYLRKDFRDLFFKKSM